MSDNDKYYYLKLKDNFYDRPEIKAIEGIQSGYEYICIIQKMYLRSLNRGGKLMLTEAIPYDIQMLSSVLNHKEETIRSAIELFKKLGLLEIMSDNTIYMTEIQNFIGESSTEADRKRSYRLKIEEHKALLTTGQMSGQMSEKNPPEIEIELKIEKEIELKKKKELKHKYGEDKNVLLTNEQYEELIKLYGKDKALLIIENTSKYFERKGCAGKYKNHYRCINDWNPIEQKKDNPKRSKEEEKAEMIRAIKRGVVPQDEINKALKAGFIKQDEII